MFVIKLAPKLIAAAVENKLKNNLQMIAFVLFCIFDF